MGQEQPGSNQFKVKQDTFSMSTSRINYYYVKKEDVLNEQGGEIRQNK